MPKEINNHILLVDTKITRRDTMASRFRMQNFTVDLANSGFQALSLAEGCFYRSVIIFDNFPDMGANELIDLIRSMINKDDMQIILVSKSADHEEVMEAYALGVSEYLVYDEKIFMPLLEKVNSFRPSGKEERSFIMAETLDEAAQEAEMIDKKVK